MLWARHYTRPWWYNSKQNNLSAFIGLGILQVVSKKILFQSCLHKNNHKITSFLKKEKATNQVTLKVPITLMLRYSTLFLQNGDITYSFIHEVFMTPERWSIGRSPHSSNKEVEQNKTKQKTVSFTLSCSVNDIIFKIQSSLTPHLPLLPIMFLW